MQLSTMTDEYDVAKWLGRWSLADGLSGPVSDVWCTVHCQPRPTQPSIHPGLVNRLMSSNACYYVNYKGEDHYTAYYGPGSRVHVCGLG